MLLFLLVLPLASLLLELREKPVPPRLPLSHNPAGEQTTQE